MTSQGFGSQPLFDVDSSQDSVREDGEGIESKTSEFDQAQHWLYKINEDFKSIMQSKKDDVLSAESVQQNFIALVEQLKVAQKKLPRQPWSKPVTVDNSVSIHDPIEYLFCNDTMKYRRKMEPINIQGHNNGSVYTNDISETKKAQYSFFPSSRYPRRAKMKAQALIDGLSSDDDDFATITTKNKAPTHGTNMEASQQSKKQRTAILINPLPNHPRDRLNNAGKASISNRFEGEAENTKADSECHPTKKRKVDDVKHETKQNGVFSRIGNLFSSVTKTASKQKKTVTEVVDVDDLEVSSSTNTSGTKERKEKKLPCPMCNLMFTSSQVNDHAFKCQGPVANTRTRLGASHSSSQMNNQGRNYDQQAWQKACEGFKDTSHEKTVKCDDINRTEALREQKSVGKNVWEETNSHHASSNRNNSSFKINDRDDKNFISDDEDATNLWKPRMKPIKQTYSNYYGINKTSNGSTNMAKEAAAEKESLKFLSESLISDDDSDEDMLKGYVTKNAKQVRKPPDIYATKRRDFGESLDERDDGEMKCARCSQHFKEEDYQTHTNACLNETTMEL